MIYQDRLGTQARKPQPERVVVVVVVVVSHRRSGGSRRLRATILITITGRASVLTYGLATAI